MMGQYVTLPGEVISHVNISRTVVDDGGLYTCIATNRAGSSSHSARLNIYGELITTGSLFQNKLGFRIFDILVSNLCLFEL